MARPENGEMQRHAPHLSHARAAQRVERIALLLLGAREPDLREVGEQLLGVVRADDGDVLAALGLAGNWREQRRLDNRDDEIRGWRFWAQAESDTAISAEIAAALARSAAALPEERGMETPESRA